MSKALPHRLAAASLAAVAGLLTACGSAPGGNAGPPGQHRPFPAPTIGLVPAPRQFTDRLVLQHTRVAAGTTIKGTLIVVNHGHSPANLNRGCRPKYEVVLWNRRYHPQVAFTLDCSALPFIIKPGVNRLPVTVWTTYLSCTPSRGQATRMSPLCLRRPLWRPPPLPAGRYEAVLIGSGIALPPPAPVPVTLTR